MPLSILQMLKIAIDLNRPIVIVKLLKQKDVYRALKAQPSLKNVDLTGTGIPPGNP